MQTKRLQGTRKYPQSEGNLALADESLSLLQKRKARLLAPVLPLAPNIAVESTEVGAIAEAKGFIAGIGLSIVLCMLWFFIVLVMYRILKPLIM